jgi:hypothetical protein
MIEETLALAPVNPDTQRIDDLIQYFSNPEPIYDPGFCLEDLDLRVPETGDNLLHILVKLNNFEAVERFIVKLREVQPNEDSRAEYINSNNENNIIPLNFAIESSEINGNDETDRRESFKIFELLARNTEFSIVDAENLIKSATDHHRIDILEFLEGFGHEREYDYSVYDHHGLAKSCKEGNIEMFKFFISNLSDRKCMYSEDDDDITPHEYIAKNKQMIDKLYDEDPEIANRILNSFIKLVYDYWPDIDDGNRIECSGDDKSFLYWIIEHGNDKLLKYLIADNIDRNETFIDLDQKNRTRSYGTRSYGEISPIDIDEIIEKDPTLGYFINPNQVDSTNNKSILHLAIENHQIEMVKILIENKNFDNFNLQDNQQKTAMHYVAEGLLENPKSEFYREALVLLITMDAKEDIRDNNSESPIDIIEKLPDSDKYEIMSIIKIATMNKELAICLNQFIDEINSDENLQNKERLLRELENALKRNKDSDIELDQSDSLINKMTSLIKDGADPYVKCKLNMNCFDVINTIQDEDIKNNLLKLFRNSRFAGRLIEKMKYTKGDYEIEDVKSEILKSVEHKIEDKDITIDKDFLNYCREFLDKKRPIEDPSSLPSPSNIQLLAESRVLSSDRGCDESSNNRQRI